MKFTFAYPYLLLLVPLLAVGGYFLHRHATKRAERRLAKFGPPARLPNMLRSVNFAAKARKAILWTAALCLLVVAIARPLYGPKPDEAKQTGAEFFIILDVSKSMLVRDIAPNRLEAVKESLAKWLDSRRGDRIGLILMAGDAFVQAPLTNDYTALTEVLGQSTPASISLGGTNIPAAVKIAVKALEAGNVKNKAVVIVSDGENLEGNPVQEIQLAHTTHKVAFTTIGVGTLEGGKVPEREAKPDFTKPPRAYVRDDYGVTAHSRLDERTLRAIAAAGGGRYFSFSPEGDIWNALYSQMLAPYAQRSESFKLEQYEELFQIPLFLALALLVLEMLISTRHKQPARPRSIVTLPEPAAAPTAAAMPISQSPSQKSASPRPVRSRAAAKVSLLILSLGASALLLTGEAGAALAPAKKVIEESEALLKAGKAAEAANALRAAAQQQPDDYYLVYNLGVASYAAGQFQDAIDAFSEATMSPDKKLRAKALLQAGNAQFQLGKALMKGNSRVGASVAWERAIETYQSAIAMKSTSAGESNLKAAQERLKTLLMTLGDQYVGYAQKSTQTAQKINELTKAVAAFERVTQLDKENKDATQKLDASKKMLAEQLRDQARDQRNKAEQITDAKKEKQQDELNMKASESYQMARNNTPEDKALEQEHEEFKKKISNQLTDKAEKKIAQASQPQPPEKKPQVAEIKKKQQTLNEAVSQLDQALAFDEKNAVAKALKQAAMKKLEEAHVAMADAMKAQGEKIAEKAPEAAAGEFSGAMQNYQKALEINPENQHAKENLAQTEEQLAKSLTAAGKKEMAAANSQKPPPGKQPQKKPGQGEAQPQPAPSPAEQSPSELRENIGHLEKAAQSFAQAEALKPGENEAMQLQQEALEQLNELRAALDQKQNALAANTPPAPGAEQPTGENAAGEPAEEAQEPKGQKAPLGVVMPTKPVLSFSEIRSKDKGEGLLQDLRRGNKIRDW